MTSRAALTGLLIMMGAGWGLTMPLTKITVSAGYQPLGLVFWQLMIGALFLGVTQFRKLRQIKITPQAVLVWSIVALLGTVLPNTASYRAMAHLPAGIMSIVISTIPLIAFPIALALGGDRFSWRRLAGLTLGLCGVALIALPEASLPDRAMIVFLPLAMIAPLCYALEGNWVARFGTAGLDPIQVLFGASTIGALISLPFAIGTGHFFIPQAPFILADATLLASALIHVVVYATYVWLVGQAGAVFAGQVSYFVTGFGVIWAMIILGERYSGWVWAALALMLVGIAMVQPRQRLESQSVTGETALNKRT